MEHTVEVKSIPVDVQFPDKLKGKIRFDTAHQRLTFRGFMCKADYDQLVRLSQDADYQNAVAQLFQLSTVSNAPPLRQFGRVLAALTMACLLLSAIVWWSLLHRVSSDSNHGQSPTSADRVDDSNERAAHN